jgi:hypothetical protein
MCLHMKRTEVQKSTGRVKYLVIMESTIATLVSQVLVMRHQMSCCRFPSFSAGSLMAFCNPKNPLAALMLCQDIKSSYYAGQGDHLDRVHSDQMVLDMSRLERLVR